MPQLYTERAYDLVNPLQTRRLVVGGLVALHLLRLQSKFGRQLLLAQAGGNPGLNQGLGQLFDRIERDYAAPIIESALFDIQGRLALKPQLSFCAAGFAAVQLAVLLVAINFMPVSQPSA